MTAAETVPPELVKETDTGLADGSVFVTAADTVPPVRVVETATSWIVTATRAAENIKRSLTTILSKIVTSAAGRLVKTVKSSHPN